MIRNKPELISPAGDWPSLASALESGADSVYFGVKTFNLRASAENFELLELKKVMSLVRERARKGYLALNVLVYDREIAKIDRVLNNARDNGVDAIICWDMAILKKAMDKGLNVHLSTQANVSNFETVKFYAGIGVKRIVIARECTLDDIKAITDSIKKENVEIEIEAFVHGALCVSVSGRCFMSQHTFQKSAMRGECLQPCRREYVIKSVDGSSEYILGKDYILSPKDLCSIGFIDRLIGAGITAFKIEGRIRPPEYVREVTSVYREGIDAYFNGAYDDQLKTALYDRLKKVYNRGLSDGFYLGGPDEWASGKLESEYEKSFLGEIVNFYGDLSVGEIILRGGDLNKGAELLVIGKKTPAGIFKAEEIQVEHKSVEHVPRGSSAAVKFPFPARRNDRVYLWNKK
ncbi:MAG: U32 family peptidase [Candidatus Omnitrophica bacterium]|nr:U32 family peptidase [Candidatus Omnitrophota bacterium]